MTKRDAFDTLWIEDEWYLMGYDKEQLFKSMTKAQVLSRLKNWRAKDGR